jgi:two-component system OmpR family sensor kinase
VLALRRIDAVGRAWRTSAVIGSMILVVGTISLGFPEPAWLAEIARPLDVGMSATAAVVSLTLVYRGIRGEAALLRRTGLALVMLTGTPVVQDLPGQAQPPLTASVAGLTGVAMLLIGAVPYAVGALRAVWRQLAESQSRLQAAEQAMAYHAVRDHEMRNLVAGLSGAESMLASQEYGDDSPEDRRQLRAAARAELERLRRLLEDDNLGLAPAAPTASAVGPLLSDLAALHSTPDAPITVQVRDDPHAAMPADSVAHIVTNLLVNCAHHAPGARVWLSARCRSNRVVIEVRDDGPGLPPGSTDELLEPGVTGASSSGSGLGLHVSAELTRRYGGALRLMPARPASRGCTVVVELPAATADHQLLQRVTV